MGQFKTRHILICAFIFTVLLVQNSEAYLFPIEPRGPLSGKSWPPGSPWPLPFSWTSTENLVTFDASTFKIVKQFSTPCEPIDFAIEKYNSTFLFPVYGDGKYSTDPNYPVLSELIIKLSNDEKENECSQFPRLSDDPGTYEYYDLEISVNDGKGVATIEAKTVWGALRGVETFSQLIWSNEDNRTLSDAFFYANTTVIHDKPRFSHRGLMIDSARHYLPERIFHEVLDGMMYNKLNVLHWHIVDDQSFPYVSTKFPELSQKGAFNDKAIYTPEMVQRVITAARMRGIRVILEFDTPGHTHGFGKAFPELLTPCYGEGPNGDPEAPGYPEHAGRENLDPTNNFTYTFMREFFTELSNNVTKDSFVHLGMDEVYMGCWDNQHNPVIKSFMEEHGYNSLHQVQEHYTMRHVKMIESLNLQPIVWQDPLDFNVNLDKNVVIQAWKDWGEPWTTQFRKILSKGYRAILSSPWYINYIEYGETWKKYYKVDPIKSIPSLTDDEKSRVLGGEACIWSEYVDKTNIVPRIFPFVSSIGERLWAFDIGIDDKATNDARGRLDQHRCRLLRRGMTVQPILNGYCGRWETENRRRR